LDDLPDWKADFQQIKIQTYTGKSLEAPDFHPGWLMDPNNTWIQKAYKGLQKAGIIPTYTTALFCTNGSYSAGIAGVPTMIFGPSTGLLAHCVNENIEIADLLQGVEGYMGLATELGRA
jgi:acetylornithine deacetylase/succinyl-diaminopimelate desuccinylase-like protein